jgi:hypothetical protein
MKNSLLISLLCVTSLTQVEGAPQIDSRSTGMAPVIRELPTNSLYQRQAKQLAQSSDKQKINPPQRSAPLIGQHRVPPKQQANQLTQSQGKQAVTNQQRSVPMIDQHRVAPKTDSQKQFQMGNFLTDAELTKHYTTILGQKDFKIVEKLTARIWNDYLTTHKMPANNDPKLKTILLSAFEKEARNFSLLNILSKKDAKFQEAYQLSILTMKVLDFGLQNDGTKSFPIEQRQAIEQQQKKYQAHPVAGDSSIGRLLQIGRAINILEAPLSPLDASLLTKLQSKGKLSSDETKRLKSIEIMIQEAPLKYKGTPIEKLYKSWKMNYPQGQGIVAKTRSAFSSAASKVGGTLQKINPFKKKTDTVASLEG